MSEPLALQIDCSDRYSVRVEFTFIEGRFRQRIELFHENQIVESWSDKTDSTDEDWPGSPPIQQLSLESINERPTLLGVGQAGKSHWSISVESASNQDEPALRFDVACRTASKPIWLGSTYQNASTSNVASLRSLRLMPDSAFSECEVTDMRVSCPLETVEPTNARNVRSQTFRWGYLIGVR